jgi:hypothetical protein
MYAEDPQKPADAHRTPDRQDADALGGQITVVPRGQRLHRSLVADPFYEHDRTQAAVTGLHSLIVSVVA